MMMNLMTVLVKKVFISSKPSIVCLLCPPPCEPFSIQESAVGGLSYKVKKNVPWHILAPRRGCFSNHLPLRRVRILAEHFDRIEAKFSIRSKWAVALTLNCSPSSRQLKKYKFFLPAEIYLLAVFMQLASKFHVFPLVSKFQDSFANVCCCSNLYNLRSFLREYFYQ